MRRARAFTLVELIVVVLLLGVVAAAVAPRLGGSARRRAEEAARAAKNLVSIAAHRDAMGVGPIALAFDSRTRVLSLESLRPVGGGERSWGADPHVQPLEMTVIAVTSALVNGSAMDGSAWRVEFPRHEPRPLIEIVLEGAGGRWVVVLLPGASEAELVGGASAAAGARSVDLDATGRGVVAW